MLRRPGWVLLRPSGTDDLGRERLATAPSARPRVFTWTAAGVSALYSDLFDTVYEAYLRAVTTIPLTEAKARLNELIEDTVSTHERVTITRHGKPAAVLISVEDLESMEETLFWQAQPGIHEDIDAARCDAAAGQLKDEAAVRRRYGVGTTR